MISSERKERRTLLILYLLAAYIVLQVCWWGYSLIDIHKQTIAAQSELLQAERQQLFATKIWMIAGEGGVFLVLLLLGFWYIRRTLTRELQLSRMEKTFLLSVTHELKTPVAAIRLFLETIKSRKLAEEQVQGIVKDALRETDRLQAMSENILLATRFDHWRDELMNEEVNLFDMISKIVVRIQSISNKEFILQMKNDVIVKGDKELLQAMCSNLIENAMKYSPASTTISIMLNQNEDDILLEIADNGIGISDAEKSKVFEKFYRSGDEQTRRHKGTGLGLYIVNSIAHLHKGKIEIRDNQPEGVIFALQFSKQ